jgi:hypothetical protein
LLRRRSAVVPLQKLAQGIESIVGFGKLYRLAGRLRQVVVNSLHEAAQANERVGTYFGIG